MCRRLALQVTIVCSAEARPGVREWARTEGLPDTSVLALAALDGPAVDLAATARHLGLTNPTSASSITHVLVIDAGTAPEPGCCVSKIIEAGITRGGAAMVSHVVNLPAAYEAAPELEVRACFCWLPWQQEQLLPAAGKAGLLSRLPYAGGRRIGTVHATGGGAFTARDAQGAHGAAAGAGDISHSGGCLHDQPARAGRQKTARRASMGAHAACVGRQVTLRTTWPGPRARGDHCIDPAMHHDGTLKPRCVYAAHSPWQNV